MDRADNYSPVAREGTSGRITRKQQIITPVLDQLVGKDDDAAAFLSTARQDSKRQEYETAMLNFSRAAQQVAKGKDVLSLSRVLLEAGDAAVSAKSVDYADAALRDAVANYSRCADVMEQDQTVHREFIEAVRLWASASAMRTQTMQHGDRRTFVEVNRKAFHLYDWVLRLVDPSGSDVSTVVLGPLSSLGQLAAQLQCYDWALELFERNQSIKEILGIETETVRRHIDKVSDRIAQTQNSREAMRAARYREEMERTFLDEFRERMELVLISNKMMTRFLQSIPPPPPPRPSGPKLPLRSRPSSGDSTHTFFKTGNFTGLTPQQELDAFRADVDEGKNMVKLKQLEDAQDHFTNAVDLAASSFSIPLEEYRSALGSLAYVFCMRAQTENEKGSKEYRKMMMKSVPHYKKVVEMTEERIALHQSTLQEEVSLASTYLQLGVVAVSLDRLETGLHYMRKAKSIREKFRMDTSQEDRHIMQVEKNVRKRDAELLAHASQLAEARKQTVGIDRPTVHQCISWYNSAKGLMQQRRCEEAEPQLLQALVGFEQLMGGDLTIRRRPEYRLTLTGLGASYYFLGQEHGKKTAAFSVNNEQALVYYNQALVTLTSDAAADGTDDVAIASLLFHVACCYANLRRYDVAAVNFAKSRDIKLRVGLTVEDIDVNLDALNLRLQSLIDEEVIRQQNHQNRMAQHQQQLQQQSHQAPLPPSSSSSNTLTSSSNNSSANSSLTTTPRELTLTASGNFESPKSNRRHRAQVSFIFPSDDSDIESMEGSFSDFPVGATGGGSDSPKLHLTGSILVEPTFGSPKLNPSSPTHGDVPVLTFPSALSSSSGSAPLRSSSLSQYSTTMAASLPQAKPSPADERASLMIRLAHMEEMAREIAADLWMPAHRAHSFIAQEERKERMELFLRLDAVRRDMMMVEFRIKTRTLSTQFIVKEEEILRRRSINEFHKQWIQLALQRIAGSEQIGRAKIFNEYRRIVSLPSADHSDRVAQNQEAMQRVKIMYQQRVAYFEIIENYQRERISILQAQYRRDHLIFPKIVDAAHAGKVVMFRGSMRLFLAQCRAWILEGETLDRFGILRREQQHISTLILSRALGALSIREVSARQQFLMQEQLRRMQDLHEQFERGKLEAMQRTIARQEIRFPMLRSEVAARETVARRETLVKPEMLLFLGTILEPLLDMHQRLRRRTIQAEWEREGIRLLGLPVVEVNERISRNRLAHLCNLQGHQLIQQNLSRLEETHRRDVGMMWEREFLQGIARAYVLEQESLHRQLFIVNEHQRVFNAIGDLDRQKMRELLMDNERSRRRVLKILHEEGVVVMMQNLETNLRQSQQREEQKFFTTIRFAQERQQLALRETLLRRVGERLAFDQRLTNVVTVMAPQTLTIMFQQIAAKKMRSVETHFRQIISNMAARSVNALQKQGLLVVATATQIDNSKLESKARVESVIAPFISGLETLRRQEISYQHRELLKLMYQDYGKSLLVATVDTENRIRKRQVADEAVVRQKLRNIFDQGNAACQESTHRDAILDEWSTTLQRAIVFPAQREKLGLLEQQQRRVTISHIAVSRIDNVLAPFVDMAQGDSCCAAMSMTVQVAEAAFREAQTRHEGVVRVHLGHCISQKTEQFNLEIDETTTRGAVFEKFLQPFSQFREAFVLSSNEAHVAVLQRKEMEARRRVMHYEAQGWLTSIAQELDRHTILREMHDEQRSILTQESCSPVECRTEEARERRWLYSKYLLEEMRVVIHHQELSCADMLGTEGLKRVTHMDRELKAREQIVKEFFHSGKLVTLQLHEMFERRRLSDAEADSLAALQAVCFERELDLRGSQVESRSRKELEGHEHCTRQEIEALRQLTNISFEAQFAFNAIQNQAQQEFMLRSQETQLHEIMEEEVKEFGEVCTAFHNEMVDVRYTACMSEMITVSEEDLRILIDRTYDGSTLEDLAKPAEALVLHMYEDCARNKVLEEESKSHDFLSQEASVSGANLEQRRLARVEFVDRQAVALDELDDIEHVARWQLEHLQHGPRLVTFMSSFESDQRQLITDEYLHRWGFLFASWMLLVQEEHYMHRYMKLHALGGEETAHRFHVEVEERRDAELREAELGEVGAQLVLLTKELTRRRQLEQCVALQDVSFPLEQEFLTSVTFHGSLESAVLLPEQTEFFAIVAEAMDNVQHIERRHIEWNQSAEANILREVAESVHAELTVEASERGDIVVASQASMGRHIDDLVWKESCLRCAQVQAWSFLYQFTQIRDQCFSEGAEIASNFVASDEEGLHRVRIADSEVYHRSEIAHGKLFEEETMQRVKHEDMLRLHHVTLEELTCRAELFNEYHEGYFELRFRPVLAQLYRERAAIEWEMDSEFALLDKQIMFEHFSMVQRTMIMTEFVLRLETIERIQLVTLVERREWTTISTLWDDEEPTLLGPAARRIVAASPLSFRGPVFAQRGLVKLPPLSSHASSAFDLHRRTAPQLPESADTSNKKRQRKHLAAIATAEECMLREALNIRPHSAGGVTSAAGTPRSLVSPSSQSSTRRSTTFAPSNKVLLQPLPAAMVLFQRSEVADARSLLAIEQLHAELKRTVTLESFQRHMIEEQSVKSFIYLCALQLQHEFEVCGETALMQTMEQLSVDVFAGMNMIGGLSF